MTPINTSPQAQEEDENEIQKSPQMYCSLVVIVESLRVRGI